MKFLYGFVYRRSLSSRISRAFILPVILVQYEREYRKSSFSSDDPAKSFTNSLSSSNSSMSQIVNFLKHHFDDVGIPRTTLQLHDLSIY